MAIGLIGQSIGSRRNRAGKLRFTRGFLEPAINELKVSLHTVENNAPINEAAGKDAQAALERKTAKSVKAAIGVLKKAK